jgi:hypothetical protein
LYFGGYRDPPYGQSDILIGNNKNNVEKINGVYMSRMVKKIIELSKDYIDKAHFIFHFRTEKKGVHRAFGMTLTDNKIIEAHERVGGKGDVVDEVFK